MKTITLLLSLFLSNIAIAEANSSIYSMEYFFSKSMEPFHAEHLTKFSICEDDSLAQCQEVASDKYHNFRTIDGYLTQDDAVSTVALSPLVAAYQTFEPTANMDNMVRNSIHFNDRIFAHVG